MITSDYFSETKLNKKIEENYVEKYKKKNRRKSELRKLMSTWRREGASVFPRGIPFPQTKRV